MRGELPTAGLVADGWLGPLCHYFGGNLPSFVPWIGCAFSGFSRQMFPRLFHLSKLISSHPAAIANALGIYLYFFESTSTKCSVGTVDSLYISRRQLAPKFQGDMQLRISKLFNWKQSE